MPDVLSIGLGGGSLLRFPAGSELDRQSTEPAAAGSTRPLNGSAVGNAGLPVATDQPAAGCSVGPDSVGAALEQQALCFGGPTATASDAAVLLGRMQLGSQPAVAAGLSREQAQEAWQAMQRMLEGALDRAKTEAGERWMVGSRCCLGLGALALEEEGLGVVAADASICRCCAFVNRELLHCPTSSCLSQPPAGDLPVIVVGGGAPLCGDSLAGAFTVLRPQHAAVANAVGAAICQASGAVDAVYDMGSTAGSRAAVLEQAQQLAEQRAEAAGAKPGSCWVASREEVPLADLPGSATRVRVKAIGELDVARLGGSAFDSGGGGGGSGRSEPGDQQPAHLAGQAASAALGLGSIGAGGSRGDASPAVEGWPPLPGRGDEPTAAALAEWQPVLGSEGEWLLHEQDLYLIALGAGILGCGGGGSPSKALLKAAMELQR